MILCNLFELDQALAIYGLFVKYGTAFITFLAKSTQRFCYLKKYV